MSRKLKLEYEKLSGEEKLDRIIDRNDEIKVLLNNVVTQLDGLTSPRAIKLFQSILERSEEVFGISEEDLENFKKSLEDNMSYAEEVDMSMKSDMEVK